MTARQGDGADRRAAIAVLAAVCVVLAWSSIARAHGQRRCADEQSAQQQVAAALAGRSGTPAGRGAVAWQLGGVAVQVASDAFGATVAPMVAGARP